MFTFRLIASVLFLGATFASSQDVPVAPPIQQQQAAPVERKAEEQVSAPTFTPGSQYSKDLFQAPFPAADLASLKQFDGMPTSNLMHDKQFHKLLKSIEPNCMFHYGTDMALDIAVDKVMQDSKDPVVVRDGRYLMASGHLGPYLSGRGFIWIDLQDGIALGGFYFHPTNGEPTPSLAVFSKQIKEKAIAFSQLPPAFNEDLATWSAHAFVPPILTRYFITGSNKRILLEHDEDYCSSANGVVAPTGGPCEKMNADAADADLTAAYYLEQVNYATNATAWMIGPEQTSFIDMREHSCAGFANPLPCRIHLTRERVHVVVHRGGSPRPTGPPPPRPHR